MLLCRVVDQYIKLSKLIDGDRNRIVTEPGIAHIARQRNTSLTNFLDPFLRRPRIIVLIQIHNRDVGTFLCKRDRDRPANSTVAARDQRNHVFQLTSRSIVVPLRLWPRPHFRLDAWLPVLFLGWP